MILPVILAGGYGERLWPLSRQSYPKQFLSLIATNSLLQDTILRLPTTENLLPPLIVCQEEHRFLAAEQLQAQSIIASGILLEPIAKSTAFAIALAACWANKNFSTPITLLILSADHIIGCPKTFGSAIQAAYELAKAGYLATFGITPSYPESGYGYISLAKEISKHTYHIKKFIEKPTIEEAKALIANGDVLWNSGMFMFTCKSYLTELSVHQPAILTAADAACNNLTIDNDFIRPDPTACQASPKISIDYGIMEKTSLAAVVPLNTNWSDIGTWHSLWKNKDKDANDNVIIGNAVTIDTSNTLINSSTHLIATIGVDNLVVVATKDAILIASQENAARTKEVVEILRASNATEISHPARVHRPWGWFESITQSQRFQVKLINVAVGKKLSLQLHHHRSEHWVIVSGTAKIICGDNEFTLTENQSTYIPIGVKHQLENIGKIPLEIIETQSGSYLGEDDIVRFQDDYGRVVLITHNVAENPIEIDQKLKNSLSE